MRIVDVVRLSELFHQIGQVSVARHIKEPLLKHKIKTFLNLKSSSVDKVFNPHDNQTKEKPFLVQVQIVI